MGPVMALPLPLDGVRVLAVEQYGAGPYASLHLAELGAEVIKIEPPRGGDSARQSPPYALGPDESQFFQCFNLGKKSLALDIRAPEGRAVFERLAARADLVMNNLRGDQPGKLRLTYADLAPVNPRLVCAHLSGYGRTGSRAALPAYDYLMQAEAGFLSVTGEPHGPQTRMGLSIVDYLTGITTAFAATAALLGVARGQPGRDIDVSLYDVAMHQLTYPAIWYLNEGQAIERRPRSGHPMVVPCETFATADGALFIMAMLPKFWEDLCRALDRPDLPEDPRFASFEARFQNRDALIAILDPIFASGTSAHWMGRLAGKCPAAPILTLPRALDNPFVTERGLVQSIDHPLRSGLKVLTNPVRPSGEAIPARPAPLLGQHTDELLVGLGVDAEERAALRAKGVIA
jgi:succinate---hydroxymethylglutarate CoA-transferase